ncbi:MAG: purine-nucleoside phosphorylase [Verrucomicrobiota bacterium]
MSTGDKQTGPIKRLRDWDAETAIILGSGLNSLVGDPQDDRIIPYAEFPSIPKPSVPGHAGRFVLGEIGKTHVIFGQGRVHLYEGYSARDVTAGVRALAEAGIKRLIVTNAAGAANPSFKPGEWMTIADHINLTGTTPLLGTAQFVDMTEAYSRRLCEKFQKAAREIGIVLHEGVYAGLLGPQYETPAEVRMLQKLGADAVGMSTVLEVIQARALGIEVAGFSCLTNMAAGISKGELSHEEVLETGKKAAADFARVLEKGLSI